MAYNEVGMKPTGMPGGSPPAAAPAPGPYPPQAPYPQATPNRYAAPVPPHTAVPMQHAPPGPYKPYNQEYDDGRCRCGAGWILFGLGWPFMIPFFVGALLPICDRSQMRVSYRRSAWIGNVVMSCVSLVWLIIVISLAATGHFRGYSCYSYNGYSYCK